jgi:hypothetical protein
MKKASLPVENETIFIPGWRNRKKYELDVGENSNKTR